MQTTIRKISMAALVLLSVLTALPADAATVRSSTGATAHVDASMQAKAQALINDLESNYGARIIFMGGWRRGHCGLGSQHPCGGGQALDVCQRSRGVVDPRCKLPMPSVFHALAIKHGLYEGAIWCSTDYGHVQLRNSGSRCSVAHGRGGVRLATMTGKIVVASAENEAAAWAAAPEPVKTISAKKHRHRVAHRHHRRYAQAG